MSKFTNAIKGMSKLKKVMVGMWLGVAATLIALVAVLISFGDKVSGKDRALDAKNAPIAQYDITNPRIAYKDSDPSVAKTVAPLAINELKFDSKTDASYSIQADVLTRFLFDVKERSDQYAAMYNTKTKVGTFFLKGTLSYLKAVASKDWTDGVAVKNSKTNEVKVIEKVVKTPTSATPKSDFVEIATSPRTNEVFTSDLDAKLDKDGKGLTAAPASTKLTYEVSRLDSTITRTTISGATSTIDKFVIVYNANAFAFNDEAKNKSNATAAVGTVFALTLVGAIGVTVAESIYRKRGAK